MVDNRFSIARLIYRKVCLQLRFDLQLCVVSCSHLPIGGLLLQLFVLFLSYLLNCAIINILTIKKNGVLLRKMILYKKTFIKLNSKEKYIKSIVLN